MHDLKKEENIAILVGIDANGDIEISLEELAELARTAGIVVEGSITQKRERPHPATYFGKGKLDEIEDLIRYGEANMLIFNDELSPAQFRNISDKFDCAIIDRTILILDIFASGANSAEGKLQVELAQLRYRMSRLSGMGKMLSRLGGGIGTRGPGETKLETDRRHIRARVNNLESELKEISKNRETMRKKREKTGTFQAALVGYTNAGKSSIMNMLTNADTYVANKLFATLDTTMRRIELPGGMEILLSDTVGFIERLPHHLVKAFRATLEELKYADMLIFVVDAASPHRDQHMAVVTKTLAELGLEEKRLVIVYNKMDIISEANLPLPMDAKAETFIEASAKTGMGCENLLAAIEAIYNTGKTHLSVLIPYADSKIISYIHENCEILKESHEESGTFFEVIADDEARNRLAVYKVAEV